MVKSSIDVISTCLKPTKDKESMNNQLLIYTPWSIPCDTMDKGKQIAQFDLQNFNSSFSHLPFRLPPNGGKSFHCFGFRLHILTLITDECFKEYNTFEINWHLQIYEVLTSTAQFLLVKWQNYLLFSGFLELAQSCPLGRYVKHFQALNSPWFEDKIWRNLSIETEIFLAA